MTLGLLFYNMIYLKKLVIFVVDWNSGYKALNRKQSDERNIVNPWNKKNMILLINMRTSEIILTKYAAFDLQSNNAYHNRP